MRRFSSLVSLVVLAAACSGAPAALETLEPTTPGTPIATSAAPDPTEDPLDDAAAEELFADPVAAAAAAPERLLAAGLQLATSGWTELGNPAYPAVERPVYVVEGDLTGDRDRLDLHAVIAWRASVDASEASLRLLSASAALTTNAGEPEVTVRRGGAVVAHRLDGDGARLLVALDPPVLAGEAVALDVRVGQDLIPLSEVRSEKGPAGFGLQVAEPDVTVLGHVVPTLNIATNAGPLVPWGDVGGFPPAVFSVQLRHEGVLVTGGDDVACPGEVDGCTWGRGVALRDVSAVAYDAGVRVHEVPDTIPQLRVIGPVSEPVAMRIGTESRLSQELFTRLYGPLAWSTVDVVVAPLAKGAAGMEFPGMVIVRDDTVASLNGGFGTYVIAHEIAHQWFHALVGNSSLEDPVVDESIAQYLTYQFFVAQYGQTAADNMVQRRIRSRYVSFVEAGGNDIAPASPSGAFTERSYGPLVYGRAPLAFIDLDQAGSAVEVVAFLRSLVQAEALREVTDDEVIDRAAATHPDVGASLQRWWASTSP